METKIKFKPEDRNLEPGHYTIRADAFALVDGHMVITDYKLARSDQPTERQIESFQKMFGFVPPDKL